jgi:hypothetical protein
MGQMVEMDSAVDRLGYLRLTTPQPTLHLMSNLASTEIRELASGMGIQVQPSTAKRLNPIVGKVFGNRLVKPLVRKLNNWTFQLMTRSHQHKI